MSLSEVDIIRVEGQELTAGSFWVYGLWLEVSKAYAHPQQVTGTLLTSAPFKTCEKFVSLTDSVLTSWFVLAVCSIDCASWGLFY